MADEENPWAAVTDRYERLKDRDGDGRMDGLTDAEYEMRQRRDDLAEARERVHRERTETQERFERLKDRDGDGLPDFRTDEEQELIDRRDQLREQRNQIREERKDREEQKGREEQKEPPSSEDGGSAGRAPDTTRTDPAPQPPDEADDGQISDPQTDGKGNLVDGEDRDAWEWGRYTYAKENPDDIGPQGIPKEKFLEWFAANKHRYHWIGDPEERDVDGDGLTAAKERELGTSDYDTDTDGDGLSDLEEYRAGTDPTSIDSDGDGITDPFDETPTTPTSPPEPATADDADGGDVPEGGTAGSEPSRYRIEGAPDPDTAPTDVLLDEGRLQEIAEALRAGHRVVHGVDGHIYTSAAPVGPPMGTDVEEGLEARMGEFREMLEAGLSVTLEPDGSFRASRADDNRLWVEGGPGGRVDAESARIESEIQAGTRVSILADGTVEYRRVPGDEPPAPAVAEELVRRFRELHDGSSEGAARGEMTTFANGTVQTAPTPDVASAIALPAPESPDPGSPGGDDGWNSDLDDLVGTDGAPGGAAASGTPEDVPAPVGDDDITGDVPASADDDITGGTDPLGTGAVGVDGDIPAATDGWSVDHPWSDDTGTGPVSTPAAPFDGSDLGTDQDPGRREPMAEPDPVVVTETGWEEDDPTGGPGGGWEPAAGSDTPSDAPGPAWSDAQDPDLA